MKGNIKLLLYNIYLIDIYLNMTTHIEQGLQQLTRELETIINSESRDKQSNGKPSKGKRYHRKPSKAKPSKAKPSKDQLEASDFCYTEVVSKVNQIDKLMGKCIFNCNDRKCYLNCIQHASNLVNKLDISIPQLCPEKLNLYKAKVFLAGLWDITTTKNCLGMNTLDKMAVVECINNTK